MNIAKAKTFDQVTEYVQETTRYYEDSPKLKYAVRFPHKYGSKCFFSDDTYDLVKQICAELKIRMPKER